MLGNAAATAAKTDTFPGQKYRRIARRRGSKRAIVALGRWRAGRLAVAGRAPRRLAANASAAGTP
jgi:hypothetical protein